MLTTINCADISNAGIHFIPTFFPLQQAWFNICIWAEPMKKSLGFETIGKSKRKIQPALLLEQVKTAAPWEASSSTIALPIPFVCNHTNFILFPLEATLNGCSDVPHQSQRHFYLPSSTCCRSFPRQCEKTQSKDWKSSESSLRCKQLSPMVSFVSQFKITKSESIIWRHTNCTTVRQYR